MSKALKCDRCKKCFDIEDEKSGPRIHIPVLTVTDAERTGAGNFIERLEEVDFCPSCTEEFMTWINDKNTFFLSRSKIVEKLKETDMEDIPKEEPERRRRNDTHCIMEDILDEQLGGAIRRAGHGDST